MEEMKLTGIVSTNKDGKLVLNYKEIVKLNKEGNSLKKIWVVSGISTKYDTFVKAVGHYRKTGEERLVRINKVEKNSMYGLRSQVSMFDEAAAMDSTVIEEVIEEVTKTKDEVLALLKKGCRSVDISEDPIKTNDIIDGLREDGYLIDEMDGEFRLATTTRKVDNYHRMNWDGTRHIKIGIVSDTHIGNVNNQMTFLHELYDRFEQEGITDVYHSGDITDGWYPNRSDHIYELHALGADQQVNYVVEHYPKRDNITTHFIIGNHDYTFIRNTGYNVGPAIAIRRPDMKYLGAYNARVWLTPNCDMELNHPGDGSAYAMSYSIQKYIDSLSGGDKPKILINGHHHKFLTMFYRNIHAIECPCTEAQTPFMKSKRLAAHMGGLILNIHVTEDGTIEKFNVELIPLYKARKNDY